MSLLKQKEPEFNTREEILDFIKNKQESLQFWSSIRTVDMTEMVEYIRNEIKEAKQILVQWKR